MDRDHISFLYVCKDPAILSSKWNFIMILRQNKIGTTFLMDRAPLSFSYICKVPTALIIR